MSKKKKDYNKFMMEAWGIYRQLYNTKFDTWLEIYDATSRPIFKKLLKTYSFEQLVALIFCHFEWYGGSGEMRSEYEKMYSAKFPLKEIGANSFKYSLYCRQCVKDDVWNDNKKLKELIDKWTKKLETKTF